MATPVPLTEIVRELLRSSALPVTHHDLMVRLLGADLLLQPGELSSVLAKLRARNEVTRKRGPRTAARGRRRVWLYEWGDR